MDSAQIAIWAGAICTGLGGLLGGWATAYVMIRKANAEAKMGERKQDDNVVSEAYLLFKEAMTARVSALETALGIVTDKLEKSREAHTKCEVAMADLKGDIKVMQEKIDRLTKHDEANKEQIEANKEKAIELAAKLPPATP